MQTHGFLLICILICECELVGLGFLFVIRNFIRDYSEFGFLALFLQTRNRNDIKHIDNPIKGVKNFYEHFRKK